MPNKYANKKGWRVPKQKFKIHNWSEYSDSLRERGNIEIWISDEAISCWYERDRVYDGTGTPLTYSDFAILTCHEVRQVYKQPLRQTEGFINSVFAMKKLPIRSPDFSCLSKRLSILGIQSPRYTKSNKPDDNVAAIAIDSTGLKRFGRDEWHQEKHKISANRSWRKLHVGVDDKHIIHAGTLTDKFTSDDSEVKPVIEQLNVSVTQVSADGAYDKNPVYHTLSDKYPDADIIIPPDSDAVYHSNNHQQRNRNLQEIKTVGRMQWQRVRKYGKRNYSELSFFRYKKILGPRLHARELSRQKQEAVIGCGVLNKMTRIGMPISSKIA